MSWLFSRVLVEEFWEDSSWDGTQSVQLKETNTVQAYLYKDKTTESWNPSRFGVTYGLLTENLGKDLLMSYLVGFPAKILAAPELEQVLTERNQDSGWKWPESSAKYDPLLSLWKTRQYSLLEDYTEFSETFPSWGTMRNGELLERTMPAHLISAIGSGSLLATPTVKANQLSPSSRKHPGCRNWIPTPTRSDFGSAGRSNNKQGSDNLRTWAIRYPTPTKGDTGYEKKKYSQGGTALSHATGGKLNPNWVEGLRGWPIGWTDLKPLAMDKYRQWLHLLGKF